MTGVRSHALVLLGVVMLLAGCGDDADQPEAAGAEDVADEQTDAVAEEPDAEAAEGSDDDASDDADEEFMTASLDGAELDVTRVSCRSGGENYSATGSGDDLQVEFVFHTLDGSTDPDPEGLHSASVFLGDRNGPASEGERYELTLAEEELAGFAAGGPVPAAAGTADLDADDATQADGSVTLDFDFSC